MADFRGNMYLSTRLEYRSCRKHGMCALKFVEIRKKNKLVTVVVLFFFLYEAGNFGTAFVQYTNLIYSSLGPCNSVTKIASGAVQLFLQSLPL